jgi:antitoxin (DNA-binding transcriptional repressor) of toxin-antitoxin stability system
MKISVTEARNSFAGLLHRVENGETVIVTRRGVAVVRLRKIRAKKESGDREFLIDFLDGLKLEL